MAGEYRIVYQGGEDEIVEKKSRFIATLVPVHSEEEALEFIESMKKKYWNARHNCFAFVVGENQQLQRCSDDGEPSGTAGKPMLEVLLGNDIHDTAVVVTRYFGGTLLGTGGLVRAYTAATKAGLEASVVIEKKAGVLLEISTDYTGLGKIQYIFGQRKIPLLNTEYTEAVKIQVLMEKALLDAVKSEITEATNGQAGMEEVKECFFAEIDGVPTEL